MDAATGGVLTGYRTLGSITGDTSAYVIIHGSLRDVGRTE